MILLDVHAHIDHARFDEDRDRAVEDARKQGLKLIINNGIDIKSNRASLELSKKYDIVKPALGLYPLEGIKLKDSEVDEELEFIKKNKNSIVAVGEVGLDKYWDKDEAHFKKQKEIFQKIIKLSERIKKPMIIHSRSAEEDVINMLESSNVKKADMHCFGGSMKLVERAAELGYSFSIPPTIVFSKHFQELVSKVNINQLLTETDSPYLSHVKGHRNEPKNVLEAVKKIAEIKKFEIEEVANNIWLNWERLKG